MLKTDKKRKNRVVSKSPGTIPAFLLKTYEILENPNYSDIISWNKEGNAFIVKKINDFSEKILPKYFKHNNFASFVRQLNMYDFHKSRHENNENEFRHKLFKRGQKHLLADIKRKTSEGHQFHQMHQIVPAHKDIEIEKFKKDYSFFVQETLNMKNRQQELENFTKAIFQQNNRLIQENKLLWTELMKNKEKSERKIEKLVFMLFHLLNNPKALNPYNPKKNLTGGPELNKITGDPNAPNDSKLDTSCFSSNQLEQNAVSLLPDPNKLTPQEQEKLYQKISKFIQYKPNGEPDYNISQLVDDISKGNKTALFKNYLSYLEECEKNNKNLMAHLSGGLSPGASVNGECTMMDGMQPGVNDYQHSHQSSDPGFVIMPNMEVPQKRKSRKSKVRKMAAISGDLMNSEDDYETQNGGGIKKIPKLEGPNVNMMSPLDMGMSNDDYGIKNELDNDFMSPNIMSSPIRNDYPALNPLTPIQPGMYGNPNMMMAQMQDHLPDFSNIDPSHVGMQNNYGPKQQSNDIKGLSDNTNYNMKDFNDMLHDMNLYQKQGDKYFYKMSHMNMGDKKLELDDSGMQSPPMMKNSGMEGFSPAIYMNTQPVPNNMAYLTNIEDLVADRG